MNPMTPSPVSTGSVIAPRREPAGYPLTPPSGARLGNWQPDSLTAIRYKGFRILIRPYQIRESRRWTVDLEVHRGGQRRAFSTDERYRTEQEAVSRCISLGKRIVDGRTAACPLGSMPTSGREPVRRLLLACCISFGIGTSLLIADRNGQVDRAARRVGVMTGYLARSALDESGDFLRRAITNVDPVSSPAVR
jgi:hypothetical protein